MTLQNLDEPVPDYRRLHRVGGDSRSVVLPKRIIDYWRSRFGHDIEIVEVLVDGPIITIKPKGL